MDPTPEALPPPMPSPPSKHTTTRPPVSPRLAASSSRTKTSDGDQAAVERKTVIKLKMEEDGERRKRQRLESEAAAAWLSHRLAFREAALQMLNATQQKAFIKKEETCGLAPAALQESVDAAAAAVCGSARTASAAATPPTTPRVVLKVAPTTPTRTAPLSTTTPTKATPTTATTTPPPVLDVTPRKRSAVAATATAGTDSARGKAAASETKASNPTASSDDVKAEPTKKASATSNAVTATATASSTAEKEKEAPKKKSLDVPLTSALPLPLAERRTTASTLSTPTSATPSTPTTTTAARTDREWEKLIRQEQSERQKEVHTIKKLADKAASDLEKASTKLKETQAKLEAEKAAHSATKGDAKEKAAVLTKEVKQLQKDLKDAQQKEQKLIKEMEKAAAKAAAAAAKGNNTTNNNGGMTTPSTATPCGTPRRQHTDDNSQDELIHSLQLKVTSMEAEHKKVSAALTDAQKKLTAASQEARTLKKEVAEAMAMQSKATQDVDALEAACALKDEAIYTLSEEIKKLQEAVAIATSPVSSAAAAVLPVVSATPPPRSPRQVTFALPGDRAMEEIRADLDAANNRIDALQKEAEKLRKTNALYKANYDELEADLARSVALAAEERSNAHDALQESERSATKLYEDREEMRGQLRDVKKKEDALIKKHNEQVTALSQEITSLTQENSLLETRVGELEAAASELHAQAEELLQEATTLQSALESAETGKEHIVCTYTTKIADVQAELAALQAKHEVSCREAKRKEAELQKALDAKAKTVSGLQLELSQAQSGAATMVEEALEKMKAESANQNKPQALGNKPVNTTTGSPRGGGDQTAVVLHKKLKKMEAAQSTLLADYERLQVELKALQQQQQQQEQQSASVTQSTEEKHTMVLCTQCSMMINNTDGGMLAQSQPQPQPQPQTASADAELLLHERALRMQLEEELRKLREEQQRLRATTTPPATNGLDAQSTIHRSLSFRDVNHNITNTNSNSSKMLSLTDAVGVVADDVMAMMMSPSLGLGVEAISPSQHRRDANRTPSRARSPQNVKQLDLSYFDPTARSVSPGGGAAAATSWQLFSSSITAATPYSNSNYYHGINNNSNNHNSSVVIASQFNSAPTPADMTFTVTAGRLLVSQHGKRLERLLSNNNNNNNNNGASEEVISTSALGSLSTRMHVARWRSANTAASSSSSLTTTTTTAPPLSFTVRVLSSMTDATTPTGGLLIGFADRFLPVEGFGAHRNSMKYQQCFYLLVGGDGGGGGGRLYAPGMSINGAVYEGWKKAAPLAAAARNTSRYYNNTTNISNDSLLQQRLARSSRAGSMHHSAYSLLDGGVSPTRSAGNNDDSLIHNTCAVAAGDEITCELDATLGTLRYFWNGIDCGVALHGLNTSAPAPSHMNNRASAAATTSGSGGGLSSYNTPAAHASSLYPAIEINNCGCAVELV